MSSTFDGYFIVKKKLLPCHAVLKVSDVYAFADLNKKSFQVMDLGGRPTIGDCAIILRAAIRAPYPSAFLDILGTTHSLGYVFGRYAETHYILYI